MCGFDSHPGHHGRVAELVDAHGSGPCIRKDVEVQILSRPQTSFGCGGELEDVIEIGLFWAVF